MKKIMIIMICLAMAAPVYAKSGKNKHKSLPPGLAKKVARGGELPPGWKKKLAKGEVLDLAVYEKAVPLTRRERKRYSTSPAGTKLLKIENKIVRVMDATRTILDVFDELEKE